MSNTVSPQRLLAAIRYVAWKKGKVPSVRAYDAYRKKNEDLKRLLPPSCQIEKVWGSWAGAVILACKSVASAGKPLLFSFEIMSWIFRWKEKKLGRKARAQDFVWKGKRTRFLSAVYNHYGSLKHFTSLLKEKDLRSDAA